MTVCDHLIRHLDKFDIVPRMYEPAYAFIVKIVNIYYEHCTQSLMEKSKSMTGVMQWPYRAVASALESLPRTLLANCGANTIRALTSLRAKHAAHLVSANSSTGGACTWGVNGETGELADMCSLGIWDPLVVKSQTYKTAIEVRSLSLSLSHTHTFAHTLTHTSYFSFKSAAHCTLKSTSILWLDTSHCRL